MNALEQPFDLQETADVHWSGKTVMAVFLSITLVSAVFFGLGYSFGRGLSIIGPPATAAIPVPSGAVVPVVAAAPHHVALHRAAVARQSKEAAPVLSSRASGATTSPRTQATPARYMVQVGAVTQRKDAERLRAALAHHGYHAGIYASNHGKLLHVEIGPLSNATQAQTIRHRVQSSGFHAILMHG
jgi:cell division protein FtsN